MAAVESFRSGESVQVLITWAYGAPPHWFSGYEVVADEGRRIRVRDLTNEGQELLYARWVVRRPLEVKEVA